MVIWQDVTWLSSPHAAQRPLHCRQYRRYQDDPAGDGKDFIETSNGIEQVRVHLAEDLLS